MADRSDKTRDKREGDILGLGHVTGGGTDVDRARPDTAAERPHRHVGEIEPLSNPTPSRGEGGATSIDMGSGGEGTDLDRD